MNGRDLRSQRIESRKADLGVGCSTAAAESGHLAGPLLPDCSLSGRGNARPYRASRVPTHGPNGGVADSLDEALEKRIDYPRRRLVSQLVAAFSSKAAILVPFELPRPVHASQPGAAAKLPLLPFVMLFRSIAAA